VVNTFQQHWVTHELSAPWTTSVAWHDQKTTMHWQLGLADAALVGLEKRQRLTFTAIMEQDALTHRVNLTSFANRKPGKNESIVRKNTNSLLYFCLRSPKKCRKIGSEKMKQHWTAKEKQHWKPTADMCYVTKAQTNRRAIKSTIKRGVNHEPQRWI